MRGLFINDMGACSCAPIKRKEIAPAIAAAIIGAGAQVLSTVGSSIASNNLNADNRDFSREMTSRQNEFNAFESEKARQHQTSLLTQEQDWNEQMYNLYNSPSAMMRQYKEAGLNPYLVDAQPSHGQSLGSPTAPSSPQAVGASYGTPNTYVPDLSGIGRAGEMALQAMGISANAANQNAQAFNQVLDNAIKMKQLNMPDDDIHNYLYRELRSARGSDFDASRFIAEFDLRNEAQSLSNQYQAMQNEVYREFGRTEKADLIMNMEQQFSVMAAEIGRLAVQNKLDESAIDRMASEIARNFASAGLDNANADLIRRSMEYLVNSAQYEARSAWFNQANAERGYNMSTSQYEAVSSGLGQKLEVVDYYTDKVVNKASKLMKFNIGISRSKSDKNYFIHNNE